MKSWNFVENYLEGELCGFQERFLMPASQWEWTLTTRIIPYLRYQGYKNCQIKASKHLCDPKYACMYSKNVTCHIHLTFSLHKRSVKSILRWQLELELEKEVYAESCQRSTMELFGGSRDSSRPYHFKFFIGCPPQILLGPFLNEYLDPIMARFNQFVWWL